MRSRIITFILIGLMCFSSVSGFLTVICQGSDGHIAVESAAHNHCQCPGTDNHDDHESSVQITVSAAHDHEHCQDILAAESFVVSKRKSLQDTAGKSVVLHVSRIMDVSQTAAFSGNLAKKSDNIYSFHVPIRTIVLLT